MILYFVKFEGNCIQILQVPVFKICVGWRPEKVPIGLVFLAWREHCIAPNHEMEFFDLKVFIWNLSKIWVFWYFHWLSRISDSNVMA